MRMMRREENGRYDDNVDEDIANEDHDVYEVESEKESDDVYDADVTAISFLSWVQDTLRAWFSSFMCRLLKSCRAYLSGAHKA